MRAFRRFFALAAISAFHALAMAAAQAALPDTIRVEGGQISGTMTASDPPVHVYKGVPFAAPPVGDLRWKAPQPAEPWEGVKACTECGPCCAQFRNPLARRDSDPAQYSEDCLYLNVWSPARDPGDKLPVMVWIHGGGFIMGSGAIGGEPLARKGVVVVSINYRLGPFGFMSHPALGRESGTGASGNYGLMDQAAALRWVRKNIAAFGGDPGRVTIFGQSAGAVSVSLLMAMPATKGLFHRAIAESGAATLFPVRHLSKPRLRMPSAEAQGEAICKALGCDAAPDPLAAMREKSTAQVLAASPKPVIGGGAIFDGKALPFWPVIDGDSIPEDPAKTFAEGRQHAVPFMIGTNADEGGMFLHAFPSKDLSDFEAFVRASFGKAAGEAAKIYGASDLAQARERLNEIATEVLFMAPARRMAAGMGRASAPAFVYHFTKTREIAPGQVARAEHSAEIPYVFGGIEGLKGADAADRALSKTLMGYWTSFAATGDPNAEGLPAWVKYDAEKDNHLEFGARIEPKANLRKERIDFVERFLAGLESDERSSALGN